jgi:hypothetical protein
MPTLTPQQARTAKIAAYVIVPLVTGWCVMQWTNGLAKDNLGERGEKLLEAKRMWAEADTVKPRIFRKDTPLPPPRPVSTPPAREL